MFVGKMVMVFVGVIIVVSIEIVWVGMVMLFVGKNVQYWLYEKDSEVVVFFEKGVELGCFKLGLIIVVCFEKDMIDFEDFVFGMVICFGEFMVFKLIVQVIVKDMYVSDEIVSDEKSEVLLEGVDS